MFSGLARNYATAVGIDLARGVALGAAGIAGRRSRRGRLIRLAAAKWVDLAAGAAPHPGKEVSEQGGQEARPSPSFHPVPLTRLPGAVLRSQGEGSTGRRTEKEKKTKDASKDATHGSHLSRVHPRVHHGPPGTPTLLRVPGQG